VGQRRSPLDVVELELLAARGWRGTEAEPLGGWLLRAGGAGFSSRAHSALAVGDPGAPLDEAVGVVADWYTARGLRPCVQLPGRQARSADAAFAAAGWARDEDTLVLTVELDGDEPGPRTTVDVDARPDEAWLDACRQHGDSPLPSGALAVLTRADRLAFASVRDEDGAVVAVARGVLTDDWLGVTAVTVAERARRGGLATSLTRGLQAWAVEQGARWCYLQVVAGNAPARALYRRLGFIEHHRYHYRRPPLPAPERAPAD
jgi:ribosomal protein S18 acetylase RimI-like enzyme